MLSYTSSTRSTGAKTQAKAAGIDRYGNRCIQPRAYDCLKPVRKASKGFYVAGFLRTLVRNYRNKLYLKNEHLIWADIIARTPCAVGEIRWNGQLKFSALAH